MIDQTHASAFNYNLQPFFDFVQTTYRNLPHAIQLHFSSSPPSTTTTTTSTTTSMPPPPPTPTATPTATATTTNTTATVPLIPPPPSPTTTTTSTSGGTSVKGMYSFRVLTECPLTVMLLFQLHPKYLKNNIPQLIPLMMDALSLRPPPYSSSNQQYHGKARELMAAQVKTLSFLTYLLRGFTDQMKPHQERIASSVISLLTYCPKEALSVRKELLVATRHVLATEYFRNAFETRHVDAILEERILLGTHKTGENLVLRPLAYSTLADLVHHVRSKLSMSQLHRVVHIFARVLHDTSMSLPLTIQATSIRLLCNMVDQIYHNTHPQPSLGRDLLFRILETLVTKFETLVTIIIPHLQSKQQKQPPFENEATFQEEDQNNNIIYNFTLENKDTMAHVKDVIQPMLLGLKTVIWCVNNYGNQRDKIQKSSQQLSERDQVALQGITSCERNIMIQYLKWALQALLSQDVYTSSPPPLETLAASFTVLDAIQFHRIVGSQFLYLLEQMTQEKQVLQLAQLFLLQNSNTTHPFSQCCYHYLIPLLHQMNPGPSPPTINTTTSTNLKQPSQPMVPQGVTQQPSTFTVGLSSPLPSQTNSNTNHHNIVQPPLPVPPPILPSSKPQHMPPPQPPTQYKPPPPQQQQQKQTPLESQQQSLPSPSHAFSSSQSSMSMQSPMSMQRSPEEEYQYRVNKSQVMMKLFDYLFQSLTKYPKNETTLRPHLQQLVATCLRLSMDGISSHDGLSSTDFMVPWPGGGIYCHLLRSLFRAIGGGKFEESYRQLLPLLPTILNGLYRIYTTTHHEPLRKVIIELCLTIPARLSSLLPHLSLLLRIIIPALQTDSGELINLGLRTLEFWIDNLNPDFLFPIFSQDTTIYTDLMISLTNHLRPAPYPYGLLTLRLLGKLGGKNRRFLQEPMNNINYYNTSNQDSLSTITLKCQWLKSPNIILPLSNDNSSNDDDHNNSNDPMVIDDVETKNQEKIKKEDINHGEDCSQKNGEMDAFGISMPLERAVNVLKLVVGAPNIIPGKRPKCKSPDGESCIKDPNDIDPALDDLQQLDRNRLFEQSASSLHVEKLDLTSYCINVMEDTKFDQAKAALTILRSSLTCIINIQQDDDDDLFSFFINDDNDKIGNELKYALYQQYNSANKNHNDNNNETSSSLENQDSATTSDTTGEGISFVSNQLEEDTNNRSFYLICEGLIYASSLNGLKKEASMLLKGLITHIFLMMSSYIQHIVRIDSNGNPVDNNKTDTSRTSKEARQEPSSEIGVISSHSGGRETHCVNGKLQPLSPFGMYSFNGPLLQSMIISPFQLNEALVDVLCNADKKLQNIVLEMFIYMRKLSDRLDTITGHQSTQNNNDPWQCTQILFENLLLNLCQAILSNEWNLRIGAYDGICKIILLMGSKWASQFEVDILHVALFSMKDAPREISRAEKESILFYLRVTWLLYGGPIQWKMNPHTSIVDSLCVRNNNMNDDDFVSSTRIFSSDSNHLSDAKLLNHTYQRVPEVLISMLINNLSSTKHLVRFAVRHGLKQFYIRDALDATKEMESLLSKHSSAMKRLLFSRTLRSLPLQDQVGIIDALAYIVSYAPSLFPVSDNHLLAFLSEILKMMSVADGEMSSDMILNGIIVDKDGYTPSPKSNSTISKSSSLSHAGAVFLRHDCILEDSLFCGKVFVPAELPAGIQLRVSAILLFRAVIKHNPDFFFDSPSSTHMGNIRPHVISLLFRTLISSPPAAVIAAHATLGDVLSLGIKNNKSGVSLSSHSHRLPKELLQTCIRPVLVNLRDHTNLNLALLRGLSRLLALLSSWFSKTLGEKLLDHLQRWIEPDKIISQKIWKEGEEPLIAAAIMDLFSLLPQASHFVEPLIKTTIKLESVLPQYKSSLIESPYRNPLTRYLNKYAEEVASFFLTEHRLKNQIYSDILLEIIGHKYATDLRKYFSTEECSIKLLNVCFERPLGIISSEKNSSPNSFGRSLSSNNINRSATEILVIHGINVDPSITKRHKEVALRQELDRKQQRLQVLRNDEMKIKETLQSRLTSLTKPPTSTSANVPVENQVAINDIKQKHQNAITALEKAKQEVSIAQQAYSNEVARGRSDAQKAKEFETHHSPRPMTLDSLELQLQGFNLVETLMANDPMYIHEHNGVVRAFRWLWRSKGRHLRLLHEDSMPPRYHGESKVLARFLVNYSKVHPYDVDVLFDLLRIFLQPTATDFSFVKMFLEEMVCKVLTNEQKRHVMQRFFSLLSSEGTEETKVLSIQLMILPMLKGDFAKESDNFDHKSKKNNDERQFVIDSYFINKFVNEALFHKGNVRIYGHRLHVGLLKLSTILLEFMSKEMSDYRKDLIKFSWNLLKSEDTNTKQWAYINACRFISVYDTPSKIILQVYVALLRSYQQEARELVRMALSIIVPALPVRLSGDDYSKAIKYTSKIIYEEGNSVPQLAHIWQTIVRHNSIFSQHKEQFIPHMMNSINKLGLPMNSSYENRQLSVFLVKLALKWGKENMSDAEVEMCSSTSRKRPLNEVDKERCSPSYFSRKQKLDNEIFVKVKENNINAKQDEHKSSFVEKSMIEAIVNFLVRLSLLSVGVDSAQQKLRKEVVMLFERFISHWSHSDIRSVYFERIVTLCVEESKSSSRQYIENMERNKTNKSTSKSCGKGTKKPVVEQNYASAKGNEIKEQTNNHLPSLATKLDESKNLQTSSLVACLDIFIVLLRCAPNNDFLTKNSEKVKVILRTCLSRTIFTDGGIIRRKLRKFLVVLFITKSDHIASTDFLNFMKTQIETFLIENVGRFTMSDDSVKRKSQTKSDKNKKVSEDSGITFDDQTFEDDRIGGRCSSLFILRAIEDISVVNPQFPESFVDCLISLAEYIVNNSIVKCKNSSSNVFGGVGRQFSAASPSIAIFEEACGNDIGSMAPTGSPVGKHKHSTFSKKFGPLLKNVPEVGSAFCCLICCLRLIGSTSTSLFYSNRRKKILQILCQITESSENVQLLMAVASLIGKWSFVDSNSCPLTQNEINVVLWKLATFKSLSLPEITVQPLFDMIACLVSHFQERKLKKTPISQILRSKNVTDESSINYNELNQINMANSHCPTDHSTEIENVIDRTLISCMLNANSRLRVRLHGIYINLCRQKSFKDEGDSNMTNASNDIFSSKPKCSPLTILWQLFNEDYEGLGSRFWPLFFVEILIAISDHTGGIQNIHGLMRGCIQYPKVSSQGNLSHDPMQHEVSIKAITRLIPEYYEFSRVIICGKTEAPNCRGDCLTAIRDLLQGDIVFCQRIFESLVASAWSLCPNNEVRQAFVPSIERLLSRPYHSQFLRHPNEPPLKPNCKLDNRCHRRLNTIQALLRSIITLRPMPMLDNQLLVSISSDYNCWIEVLSILEYQAKVIQKSNLEYTVGYELELVSLLCRGYSELNEKDILLGLLMGPSCNPGTKYAVSLDLYSNVQDALSAYSSLIDDAESICQNMLQTNGTDKHLPSEFELCIWEDRWIALQQELCQWPILKDYATQTSNYKLQLDCAWKSRDWEKVRSICRIPSITAALEIGSYEIKMNEIFLSIADGKLNDVENLHAQTAQLCLYKWQLLPSICIGTNTHVYLLQSFHRLVELRESGQIMVETSSHSSGRTLPDLKNLLSSWRHRLPNKFDAMSCWEDIFHWRTHMFTAITTNFSWSEPGTLATLHDRPWTAFQMAKIARKQGMNDISLLSLSKLTDCAMDVSDAFSKLREQILSYRHGNQVERTGGLNLVNTTNLSYFDTNQKSELFRLKAEFLASLEGHSKANQAFCHATQICPTYARAWVSWGHLCASLAEITEKQGHLQGHGMNERSNDITNAKAKNVARYLAQSLGCYLEAVQCDSSEWTRIHLAKCLWILTKDVSNHGILSNTLEKYGISLAPWVWLPWVPQLLTSLCRVESRPIKKILSKIVTDCPQAVYYALRAFYIERRDIEKSKLTPNPNYSKVPSSAVNHSEELMSILRRNHPTLWSSLECILEELIIRFRPSYEEELLTTVRALLQRADSQLEHQKHAGAEKLDEEAVRASFSKTLSRVSAKFFRPLAEINVKDDRAKKSSEFTKRYKESFEKDFFMETSSQNSSHRLTLNEIISKLKKWKTLLEIRVASTPCCIPLMQASPILSEFSNIIPDLWSGACGSTFSEKSDHRGRSPKSESVTHSSPLASALAASTAAAIASKAVALAAAREGSGGYYGGGSSSVEIPGQYVPNKTNTLDSCPSPELHAKLFRFHPKIMISKRNDQIMRQIGMIGNDGKIYRFLFQFAIPYCTRTDERTCQLHYLFGKFLKKEISSSRRHLSIQPRAVIPVAQRLRMTLVKESDILLETIYNIDCKSRGADKEEVLRVYQNKLDAHLESKDLSVLDVNGKTEHERQAKKFAFEFVCKNVIDSHIFTRYVERIFLDIEKVYFFRRIFTVQLALNSLLQYIFSANDRSPSKFMFNLNSGQMLSPEFRFSYNNQGFLEGNKLPFRMTRNIQALLGKSFIDGIFIPSMASAAAAFVSNKKTLNPMFCLLLRDDIVAWYISKSQARTESKIQELERQLSDRVTKNVSSVQSRLEKLVPKVSNEESSVLPKVSINGINPEPIDMKLRQLISFATSSEHLCLMPVSYHAWL